MYGIDSQLVIEALSKLVWTVNDYALAFIKQGDFFVA